MDYVVEYDSVIKLKEDNYGHITIYEIGIKILSLELVLITRQPTLTCVSVISYIYFVILRSRTILRFSYYASCNYL